MKDIPAEIEESVDVVARILNTTTKLGRYRRKEAKKTIQAVSEETITIQDGENAQVSNDIAENSGENIASNSSILINTSTTESVSNNGNPSILGGTAVNSTTSYKPKLPKLSLAKFKGEVTRWNTFWDSFESAIHNNISKIDKFNYLNSLLEGIALRVFKDLP